MREELPPLMTLYSLREVSEAGYGSIPTLHRAIREGRLEAFYVGNLLKVSKEALEKYVRPVEVETLR